MVFQTFLRVVGMAVVLTGQVNFSGGCAIAQEVVATETPITIGSSFELESRIMQSKRQVNVWLPPSYGKADAKSDEKDGGPVYPVLYVIDGGLDQDFHHISGLAQLATINASFETCIVVGIKTQDRVDELCHMQEDPRYQKLVPTKGNSNRFARYISEEVVPFVESRYRTGKRKAVIGESLAGLFVVELFLKKPNAFTDFISISPSLWWDDKALAKQAPGLLKLHNDKPRRLYLTMADEGGTMRRGLDMVMDAIKESPSKGLEWSFVDRSKTESHATIYHPASHDALLKLFGLPQPDYGELPWYLVEGGQPEPETRKSEKASSENDGDQ